MTFLVMFLVIFDDLFKILFFSEVFDITLFLELSMLSLKIKEILASPVKTPLNTLLFNAFDHGPCKMLAIIFYLGPKEKSASFV